LDNAAALTGAEKLGTAGAAAGEKVAKGLDSASEASRGLGADLAGVLNVVQQVGGAINNTAQAYAQEFNKAAEYTKKMAQDFADLRAAMQQVAALRGEQGSNAFTLGQARAAEAASLSPQDWIRFQEEFQSRGGAYLEGEQARFVEREGESADTQAERYQQQIAEFAKARGISAPEAASLGGGLLQFSKGPQTVEDLMSRYGKVFKTLERAPTPVAQLLPQMTRVMAQGASPEESAQLLGIMSEAMPGEEETGVVNVLKALTQAQIKGKGDELGLKKGMSPLEMIKAAAGTLKERAGRGEDLDKIMSEYFPDIREMKGMKGFISRGLEAGGFEREAGYIKETPGDFVPETLRQYERSDAGRKAKRLASQARIDAERGARYDALQAMKEQSQLAVTGSGDLEKPEGFLGWIGTKAGQAAGLGDRKEQEIRAVTVRNLTQALQGYQEGREWLRGYEGNIRRGEIMGGAPRGVGGLYGGPTEELLMQAANELKRLREIAEKQRESSQRAQGNPPPAALPAKPAVVQGRA
jgi:hypothetical protein